MNSEIESLIKERDQARKERDQALQNLHKISECTAKLMTTIGNIYIQSMKEEK